MIIEMIPAWVDGTLSPQDKLDVHRKGLRHPAVSVFVMSGDRTLLQKRAPGKYHTPGLWTNACCTHPAWGETAAGCAERHLQQELGIAGLVPEWRGQVEYRADVGGGLTEHEVVEIFVAEAPAGLRVAPDPAEVAAVNWMRLADLTRDVGERPGVYTPWLAIYLADHAGRIFGPGLRSGQGD